MVHCVVYIQEIRPWPPSHSLRSLDSVYLQWKYSDQSGGSTRAVIPSLGFGVGDGKIKFNESFKLPVILTKEAALHLEFSLYGKAQSDMTAKEQLLGTALVDLTNYRHVKKTVTLEAPMSFKRRLRNAPTVLLIKLQPINKHVNGVQRKVEEAEVPSFSDDDASTPSSLTISSPFEGSHEEEPDSASQDVMQMPLDPRLDLSSEMVTLEEDSASFTRNSDASSVQSSPRSIGFEGAVPDTAKVYNRRWSMDRADLVRQVHEKIVKSRKAKYKEYAKQLTNPEIDLQAGEKTCFVSITDFENNAGENNKDWEQSLHVPQICNRSSGTQDGPIESGHGERQLNNEKRDEDIKEMDVMVNCSTAATSITRKKKVIDVSRKESKFRELECKVEKLERELTEAAAIEMSLYSIVAEHGSSLNKFYAPARRLSRFYFHACKEKTTYTRASAGKSVVSGLVLVTKACANDVPRLTFWLSNSVALRMSVTRANMKKKVSSLKHRETKFASTDSFEDWDDPSTFVNALAKNEALVFTRIVESLWWQIFTPHMQSTSGKATNLEKALKEKHKSKRNPSSEYQEQAKITLDIWKKAFEDAYYKLCPLRSERHDCVCLSLLSRLIMEQCIHRLDVAMFNALLRESPDRIPTDPVFDPISNVNVLPVLAGKSSFGIGAQLKNAIGSWSRCLSDLFPDEKKEPFKFKLLNELSELMMLPKDMLLKKSIRKEVCPTFGTLLIKRVLMSFVADEFCQDQIPDAVLKELDSQGHKKDEGSIRSIPCNTTPIVYLPPSTASLANILQVQKSVLWKSYHTEDELDGVASAYRESLCSSSGYWKPKESGGESCVRYQLLRDIWRGED
ncbi:hypothetical protein ACHQM5_008039 [Ranunculus cassubicifolius]